MWGEYVEGINIIKTEARKNKIKSLSYSIDDKFYEVKNDELFSMKSELILDICRKVIEYDKLQSNELGEAALNSSNNLAIYFSDNLFCVGIINGWDDTVYYYDSGLSDSDVIIGGNIYPKYMTSTDKELLWLIIEDFVKTGKLSKQVKWRKQ